jgi:multiple sugar transport system permease protein
MVWTISCVIAIVLLNIGFSILLNQDFKGRNIFRLIILVLPWATPDIVAAVEWKWMYNAMYGVINDLFMRAGFISSPVTWLGKPNLALLSVIIANIWKGYPVGTMIMLAALQTIPVETYEAAQIDGCHGLKTLFLITLPSVAPTLKAVILISAIWTINYLPLIYIMTGGGPAHGTDTFVTWSYRESFSFLQFNKGSAGIVLIFIITLVLAIFYIRILTRASESL